MNVRAVLAGLVAGLVFGAGVTSLVWALAVGGGNEDVAAVCGVVERTELPDEKTPIEELRRWGVSEVMASVAKADPEYQPLADALERALRAMQTFDRDEMREAVDLAKELCDAA